ncbi:hypothetical protein HOI18_03670 [Candidatus Uhrbacteria bacterium]|jgi:hypothetical protein|nr:hypothetical protein [Candidatus Uhrbacteria bacterium]
MSFRFFLIVMSIASVTAWIAWAVVVNAIDPTRAGFLGFILFFLTLTTAMVGTLTVLGVMGRIWMKNEELVVTLSVRAFRQALLLSSVFIGALVLSGFALLRWWSVLLILLIVSIVELIFLSLKKRPS